MKTEFSKEESLSIINEMIAEARSNFNTRGTQTMAFMAYAVIAVSVFNIVLLQVLEHPYYSYFAWLLMVPILLFKRFVLRRKEAAVVITHIDRITTSVWSTFGICNTLFLITIFSWAIVGNYWVLTMLIMPVILLFISLSLFVTAVACRFKPYKIGAYIFALGTIACIFSGFTAYYHYLQFVILIVCMALGFILPSIQLKKIALQNV